MDSGAMLKVKVEIAYPLVTPQEIVAKTVVPASEQVKFNIVS